MLINEKYKVHILESDENRKYCEQTGFYQMADEGKKIFVISTEVENPKANIIMVPPYGKAAHQNFLVGYYLKSNSLNVIRFDGVDSVGFSSGEIINYRMSRLERDLDVVATEVKRNSDLPLICLSMSLSFPVSLKYACKNNIFSKVLAVVGVINTEKTLERVTERSLDEWRRKEPNAEKTIEVFGHKVNAQQYLDDMWENGYDNIDASIQLANKLRSELKMIVAAEDEYVKLEEFNIFKESLDKKIEYVVIDGVSHEMGKSIFLCKKICEIIIKFASNEIKEEIINPKITEIIKNSSIESNLINECEYILS